MPVRTPTEENMLTNNKGKQNQLELVYIENLVPALSMLEQMQDILLIISVEKKWTSIHRYY